MSPLVWKVYRGAEMVAATRHAEDAAAVVAITTGAPTIKCDGRIVWREGMEAQAAAESYDYVSQLCWQRRRENAQSRAHRIVSAAYR